MTPAIFGTSGLTLTTDERAFFRESDPLGYILFGRNIETREQVRVLTDALRDLSGRADLPILIDQEGGRVARLKAPIWPEFPSGAAFDRLYDVAPASAIAAARANAQAIALVLAEIGITVDCLPLLDVRQPGAHAVIGDRALGSEPLRVAALGRAVLEGLAAGGVVGVVKHIPGHGRTTTDTHKAMPTVTASAAELETDLAPFRALKNAPMAMTGHLLFTAWDTEQPATLSATIIRDIIRGSIGFEGLLMTDDLDMEALSGDVPSRAIEAVAAGCDVALNCWGRMSDMVSMAEGLPPLTPRGHERLERAMATLRPPTDASPLAELFATRDALLALA